MLIRTSAHHEGTKAHERHEQLFSQGEEAFYSEAERRAHTYVANNNIAAPAIAEGLALKNDVGGTEYSPRKIIRKKPGVRKYRYSGSARTTAIRPVTAARRGRKNVSAADMRKSAPETSWILSSGPVTHPPLNGAQKTDDGLERRDEPTVSYGGHLPSS
jgi:hypothetical protein